MDTDFGPLYDVATEHPYRPRFRCYDFQQTLANGEVKEMIGFTIQLMEVANPVLAVVMDGYVLEMWADDFPTFHQVIERHDADNEQAFAQIRNPETSNEKAMALFLQMAHTNACKDAELKVLKEETNEFKDANKKRVWRSPLKRKCSSRHDDIKFKWKGDFATGRVIQVELLVITEQLYEGTKGL